MDGDVDRPEFGAVVVPAVANFSGNLAGDVEETVCRDAVVVAGCGDGENELAGAV